MKKLNGCYLKNGIAKGLKRRKNSKRLFISPISSQQKE